MTQHAYERLYINANYVSQEEKEIVFAQQKQSVSMSINEFVEMTVFLCLICFSIYDKMQGSLDESGLFIFLFIYIYIFFRTLCRNSKWPPKVADKRFFGKNHQ